MNKGFCFIIDTNVLRYCVETREEAIKAAFQYPNPKLALQRRLTAQKISRAVIATKKVIVPRTVKEEITRTKERDLRERMLKLIQQLKEIDDSKEGIEEIKKELQKISVLIVDRNTEWQLKRMRRLAITEEDARLLAIAKKLNAILVTGDRQVAEVAKKLGIRVLYLFDKDPITEARRLGIRV